MENSAIVWAYESENLPDTIKGSAHAVLVALCYSLNHKTGQCNPSILRLTKLTRLKSTAVKQALNVLKRAGLISLVSGKRMRKNNNYRINFKSIATTAPISEPSQPNAPTTTLQPQPTPATPSEPPMTKITTDKPNKEGCGFDAAYELVMRHIQEIEPYWKPSYEGFEEAVNSLANALALFPRPTKLHLKNLLKQIRCSDDWVVLDDTIDSVERQLEAGRTIHDMAHYFLHSFYTNLSNSETSATD